MFRIGDFSKIAQVSGRLLRYYDQIGLLSPEWTDPQTGYRYYSAQQLPQLNRILVLKELGLSLEQVAHLLARETSTDEMRGMLALRKAQIEQSLQEEMERLSAVEARLEQIDTYGQVVEPDVVLKPVAAQPFLALREVVPGMQARRHLVHDISTLVPEMVDQHSLGHIAIVSHSPIYDPEALDGRREEESNGRRRFLMRAIVLEHAGPPEVLEIRSVPRPEPRPGWVLIQVKAFGLNRSELFTRQGYSPGVTFPRVLGIECVGVVQAAPGTSLQVGQTVAAVMGGMGRQYDGGYAEYTLVPESQVMPLHTQLAWEILAAIPETYLTAWGALFTAMEMEEGMSLLVRGGTSSVGMAAITLAKDKGLRVFATTRTEAKAAALREQGADEVIIDTGQIAQEVKQRSAGGVHGVLELIGTGTLLDSLQASAPHGIVCFTGMLGNDWVLHDFEPMAAIPATVKLTQFSTESVTAANSAQALRQLVDGVAAGRYRLSLDKVFPFEHIVEAHRYMEENRATGKLVVLVDEKPLP